MSSARVLGGQYVHVNGRRILQAQSHDSPEGQ